MSTSFISSSPLHVISSSPSRPRATSTRRPTTTRNAVASPPPPTRPPSNLPPSPPPAPSSSRRSENQDLVMTSVIGQAHLQAEIDAASRDSIVVVFFNARWCRVCRTLASKLPGVAERFPKARWVSVDNAERENKYMCRMLHVDVLPTFRIYRGRAHVEDCLTQFTSGPFGKKKVIEHIEKIERRCGLNVSVGCDELV